MGTKVLTFFILCFTSAAFAEDFKTVNGKEYKDATVTRVEPDGIVVKTNTGVTKIYFTELPKDVQEHFHYDSRKPRRILPSRPPITPHIKSNRRKADATTGRRRKEQCGTSGTTSRPQIAPKACKPATATSETGR
jgi:hypothetical protein